MEEWLDKEAEQCKTREHTVNDILITANELDLDEILVLGVSDEGVFYLDSFDDENIYAVIGQLETYKQELMNRLEETIDMDG
jgi:hypothetical protein